MKKFLLTSMMAGAMLTAAAATPPEVLYLVGEMNGWTAPDMEEGRGYQLTDADKDGVYTGSFEFSEPTSCNFKIFTQVAGWTDSEAYLGLPDGAQWFLFKGDVDTMPLGTWPAGYSGNIVIDNWAGGTLNISVKLTETDGKYISGTITLSSDTQPDFPEVPSTIYLIGSFNDYKTPNGNNLNGAVALHKFTSSDTLPGYEGRALLPGGPVTLAICYVDPETGNTVYACPLGGSISLYSQAEGEPAIEYFKTVTADAFNKETDGLTIKNWSGGPLTVRYALIEQLIQLQWDAAPLNDFPKDALYMILETNDGKEVMPVNLNYYTFIDRPTKIKSITFSTENSVNPDPSTIWGVPADEDNLYYEQHRYELTKGGNPIKIEYDELSSGYVYINTVGRWALIDFNKTPDYNQISDVYLVGYMTDWREPAASYEDFYKDYSLENVGNGIFRGTFLCPASDSAFFRFYQALTGWDGGASIGATMEDYVNTPVTVMTENWYATRYVLGGKGNWALEDWNEDKYVVFELNMRDEVLNMMVTTSGINGVETSDDEATYFTLQGVRIAEPSNGIYIKVTSKGSEKVYIR